MQEKINSLMKQYNVTFSELAEKLNISRQTLTKKVNGTMDWTYQEIMILVQLFEIKNPQEFFF